MPRTVEHEPLQKHSLLLYEGDFDRLSAYYPELGATVMIRRLVRKYLDKIEGAGTKVEVKVEL